MVLCLCAVACSRTTPDPGKDYSAIQKELDVNKNKWAAAAITHYRFDYILYAYSLSGGIWYTVEVDQKQVVSIKVTDTQEEIKPADFTWIKTFEGNFQDIQNAINSKANKITVTFDPTLGFVDSYYIDPIANMADDENGISIKNVVIL